MYEGFDERQMILHFKINQIFFLIHLPINFGGMLILL